MPKIDAILVAERKLAILEDTLLNGLREERALLASQLAHLDQKIEEHLAPVNALLEAAREAQRRTLTKWVGDGHSMTRYVLLPGDGATDKCWDARAWLRIMKHGGDVRANERWWWTLDIHHSDVHGYCQFTLDPRQKSPTALAPSVEAMMRAADEALLAEGFTLTDLEPAGFKP